MPNKEFLQDGGIALAEGRTSLPPNIYIPKDCLSPIGLWDKKRRLGIVSFEVNNLMFSLVVDWNELQAKLKSEDFLIGFHWKAVMNEERAATGETYRPLKARII